ncbi:hypothetical protein BMR1_02g03195 [Babesia microti strain RI]|uniref:Uncharacterized protein n=1 Tax=Babesia microti (strain RI) TaxID=1133968 RepID=A0A1R4AAQ9_BABMR|nr:hypothetical protein BMR1_02g03195 [Babesia microti strain RI]SJK86088.1 hypothetical protein BMR1_02g03195 [Babesia microti strain RI]|eukprot:XP_021338284.1 hypothetical protein BMR1_02g03195 [Babesia microti strain RI]
MATSLRDNECVQIFIPWRLHASIFQVFNDFSDHGRLYYEGFRTMLLSAISSYKLSSYHLDNIFSQVKNGRNFIDFELFLLAIEKLSMFIDKKNDKILNNILYSVGNFYKGLNDTGNLDVCDPNYTRVYKNSSPMDMPNKLTSQESLDLLTQYQSINIGVKYNLNKYDTITTDIKQKNHVSNNISKLLDTKINVAETVKQDVSKNTVEAATSTRSIEPNNNNFLEKLETLDNVFKNTQLLRLDLDKMTQNYMSLKNSEEVWGKMNKDLENEKSSLHEMIESLLSDKKNLSDLIEKLDNDKNNLKSLLEKKEKEVEIIKNVNIDLLSLEKMLALDSHEDTTIFLVFTYYRKLDPTSGTWVIDENSIVDFVFDYGLVEEHPVEEGTLLRAKLAFEKASNDSKNLDFIHFKLFLAEYGRMAFMEDDANRALKLTVEKVIGESYLDADIRNHNCSYQLEFQPDESQADNSMPVQGTLWFQ